VFYTLPMSYASQAFAATVGMYWSALSSPRQGLNSPIGLAPFIGILPTVATLGAVIALGIFGNDSTGALSSSLRASHSGWSPPPWRCCLAESEGSYGESGCSHRHRRVGRWLEG
jgi:hypothetical protein